MHQLGLCNPNSVMQHEQTLGCLGQSLGSSQIFQVLRKQMTLSAPHITIAGSHWIYKQTAVTGNMLILTSNICSRLSHISALIFPLGWGVLLVILVASSTSLRTEGPANLPMPVFSATFRRYFKYNPCRDRVIHVNI